MRFARVVSTSLAVGTLALLVAPKGEADETQPCSWQIEYTLAAKLVLSDTPMGEGDGTYTIGPGTVVLRYENRDGAPGGAVEMLSYAMRESFVIKSKTLFWSTTVVTSTHTAATPDQCSIVARGALEPATRNILWKTPIRGYRTDGTLTCSGSMCGKFGAPPRGEMQLHIGPSDVQFSPFVFAPDMKTFTMAATHVSKTSMPKQSAAVTLAGRERSRACVPVPTCGKKT